MGQTEGKLSGTVEQPSKLEESRLQIHSVTKVSRLLALIAICIGTSTACLPSGGQQPSEDTASPTAFTAPQLGPTSTPKPVSASPIAAQPTPTIQPLDPVNEADWIRGPTDAPYSFLVYCDFQSPPCAEFARNFDALRELRPGEIELIYRQFPLLVLNDKAGLAAELALAADEQDAFWPMHDLLYRTQQNWTDLTTEEFILWAQDAAQALDIDANQIAADLRNETYSEAVQNAFVQGVNSGLPGTPFLLLNGEWFRASPTVNNLEAAIRLEALAARQYPQPPDLEIDTDLVYIARFHLTNGDLVMQLFPESAPASVSSFIFLARQGWYDDTLFHRVFPGSFVEAGDPTATGFGGAGYFLPDEIDPSLSFDRPGRLAMVNSGPDTNSSIFAITLKRMPSWQGARTIFGQVVEGLPLLTDLEAREPLDDLLVEPDLRILEVEIEEQ